MFLLIKTLFRIYNSLIFPYLSYGLVAWGQAAKTHLEKLLTLQKRAVRLINSNIMPITMLYFKLSSMLMFDVYNNTAPHNIFHISLFLLNKSTLTALAPPLLEIITLATLD